MTAGGQEAVSRSGDTRSPGAAVPAGLSGRGAEIAASGGASPPWSKAVLRPKPSPPGRLYTGHNIRPTYSLRYDWTGWPTAGTTLPPQTADIARATVSAWEVDGLYLHELRATPEMIQLLFHVTPQVSPVFCCQRAKGRLQHMPDHVHMALRGDIQRSPKEIALAFQNGLARAAGCRAWQDGFYVGTFSEYDLDVIRRVTGES